MKMGKIVLLCAAFLSIGLQAHVFNGQGWNETDYLTLQSRAAKFAVASFFIGLAGAIGKGILRKKKYQHRTSWRKVCAALTALGFVGTAAGVLTAAGLGVRSAVMTIPEVYFCKGRCDQRISRGCELVSYLWPKMVLYTLVADSTVSDADMNQAETQLIAQSKSGTDYTPLQDCEHGVCGYNPLASSKFKIFSSNSMRAIIGRANNQSAELGHNTEYVRQGSDEFLILISRPQDVSSGKNPADIVRTALQDGADPARALINDLSPHKGNEQLSVVVIRLRPHTYFEQN